eukprot:10056285-Alexandrium_andersonii.AAC.1
MPVQHGHARVLEGGCRMPRVRARCKRHGHAHVHEGRWHGRQSGASCGSCVWWQHVFVVGSYGQLWAACVLGSSCGQLWAAGGQQVGTCVWWQLWAAMGSMWLLAFLGLPVYPHCERSTRVQARA